MGLRYRRRRAGAWLAAVVVAALAGAAPGPAAADEQPVFHFELVTTLDAMQRYLRTAYPPGAPRAALRAALVEQGGASLRADPARPGTEKYLYDINLCRLYVWRWNISADYDGGQRLVQVWVNGEPVHAEGPQKPDPRSLPHGARASILKMARARPEADRGEKQLAYLMVDLDGDTRTTNDQLVTGAGPTRADPANAGTLHVYTNVEPWRSIFDPDAADRIVDYAGSCPAGR